MSPLELDQWLVNLSREVRATNRQFPRNLVKGWPIPFFGDILHARVLTVGVNPSDKEFGDHCRWDEITNPAQLQARLLGYFQKNEVRPWIWFETWSICLTLLDLGYAGGGAAHIDVSPRPTTPMLHEATDKPEFRKMAEHDIRWFFEILGKLPEVQLLLVAGPIPRANGSKQQLADFISEHSAAHGCHWQVGHPVPKLVTPVHPNGIPVFVCPYEPEVDGLYAMVRHVHRSRELLLGLSAPPSNLVPIMPARLDWPSAIGNFMLNFGTLEYFVFVFLKDHLAADEFDKIKEWHFNDRVGRIAKHLREAKYSEEEQKAFAQLLERLEPIRELRNHIAHGHMYWQLEKETQKSTVTLFKGKDLDTGHLPDSKHVDFLELQEALRTLPELIGEFERMAGFKTETLGTVANALKK